MNSFKHFYLLLILAFAVTLVSCDDDDDPVLKTKTELLLDGEWSGNKVVEDGVDVTEIWKQGTPSWDMKKYSMEFLENGTYVQRYEGQPDQSGTWRFTRNEEYIKFNEVEEVEVATLEDDELQLIYIKDGIAQEHFFVR